MNINRYSLFLLLLLTGEIFAANWKIEVWDKSQPSSEGKPIVIPNGRFHEIKLVLTPIQESNVVHASTTIKLNDTSIFTTAEEWYQIDSRDSYQYIIDIGVDCGNSNNGKVFDLTFISTEESSDFEIANFQIMFNVEEPTWIHLTTLGTHIGLNSYSQLYKSSHHTKNVEEVKIFFTPDKATDGKGFVQDFVIKPYRGINHMIEVYYSRFGMKEDNPIATQVFEPLIESTCFKVDKAFTFQYDKSIVLPDTKQLVNSLIRTATLANNKMLGSITIEVNIAVAPVMMYCALQPIDDQDLTDQEILDHSKQTDYIKLQFYIDYFSSPGWTSILFYRVSRFVEYKLKCVFKQPTLNPVAEPTTVKFGYHKDADVTLSIHSDDAEPTPTHCISWKFNKKVDVSLFLEKSLSYCYDFLSSPLYSRKENGCMSCVERDVSKIINITPEQSSVGICMKSEDNCETTHKESVASLSFLWQKDLDTTANIKKNLGLDNYELSELFSDDDLIYPEVKEIKITNVTFNATHVNFNALTNEKKRNVECSAIAQKRSQLYLTPYEFKQSFILDHEQYKTLFSIAFEEEDQYYDSMMYNLILQCKNIAGFKYTFQKTEPFVVAQFIKEKGKEPIEPMQLQTNCENPVNFYKVECIPVPKRSLMPLQTSIPIQEHNSEYKKYLQSSPTKRIEFVFGETLILKDVETIPGKLEISIWINDWIHLTNCREFVSYNKCREDLIKIQNSIIDTLKPYLESPDIITQLKNSDQEIQINNFKLAYLALFFLNGNANAFSKESSERMINFLGNIRANHQNILNWFKSNPEVQKDLTLILTGAINNFMDVAIWNDIDEPKKTNEKTKFIMDNSKSEYTNLVTNFTSVLAEAGIYDIEYDRVHYKIEKLVKSDNNTWFEYKFPNIKVNITVAVNKFIDDHGADKIAFVFYKNYPMLSYETQKKNVIPVISIKLLDKDNKEIAIEGWDSSKQIKLFFYDIEDVSYTFCYYYKHVNTDSLHFEHKGLVTDQSKMPENILGCYVDHLTDFTIGSYDIGGKIYSDTIATWIMVLGLVLILAIIATIALIVVKLVKRSKKKASLEEEINVVNKASLLEEDD